MSLLAETRGYCNNIGDHPTGARWRLPKAFPGALAGLLVGCFVYYAMHLCGMGPGLGADGGRPDWTLRVLLPMPHQEFRDWWDNSWREALTFLPGS